MDDFNQIIEREYISFYKFDYQKIRLNNFTLQYNELEQSKDSIKKLTNLILLDTNIHKVHFHKSLKEEGYLIVSRIGDEIRKLEKLQNLGLLSENIETNIHQNNQNYSVASKFRLAQKKKTDFIKILSAMYDNRMFETEDGYQASSKQELMNEFGRIVNEDLGNYSVLLSKSKNPEIDVFLKPFDTIRSKAEEYYNKELNQ